MFCFMKFILGLLSYIMPYARWPFIVDASSAEESSSSDWDKELCVCRTRGSTSPLNYPLPLTSSLDMSLELLPFVSAGLGAEILKLLRVYPLLSTSSKSAAIMALSSASAGPFMVSLFVIFPLVNVTLLALVPLPRSLWPLITDFRRKCAFCCCNISSWVSVSSSLGR